MFKFIDIFSSIVTHPHNRHNKLGAVFRFISWQLSQRLFPYPSLYSVSEKSKILMSRGLTGATGCIYFGLSEFSDMLFVLHFLRKEDLFVDVGSNVGVYSILAGCETACSVVAIEPIPDTFVKLVDNIRLNNLGGVVEAVNIGLADISGELYFSSSLDTVNHVMAAREGVDVIRVLVDTLDNICPRCPALLKIDVEGYESKVLIGAINVLRNPSLKVVIVEINGSGDRYGYKNSDISKILTDHGFVSYSYNPIFRDMVESPVGTVGNAIFIRDKLFVERRIASGARIRVGCQEY
jgi:FkbM family methyltransferase